MTPSDELVRRCDWVMRRNEKLLAAEGGTDPDWYFGKGLEGSLLYHLRLGMIGPMMNVGPAKEILFSQIRLGVETNGYDCVIFCNDAWARCGARPEEKHRPFNHDKAVEALCVVGQTPVEVCMIMKSYRRDGLRPDHVFDFRELSRGVIPAQQFGGRTKMFGDWDEPGMNEAYTKLRKFIQRGIGLEALGKLMARSCELINIATEEP